MFSLIGTWSHELARAYLALEIGGTTAALGSLLVASAVPSLVLTLHGGLLADRLDSRKIIVVTKSLLAVSTLIFYFLVLNNSLTLPLLYFFAFIEGIFNSYDSPAYTATFQRLVPKSDFKMAVTLQSTNFHMSRMIGPAIAGLIMRFGDTAQVFLFDFFTYLVVIFVLRSVQLRDIEKSNKPGKNLSQLKDAFTYFFKTPSIRYKLLQFLLSLGILMPVVSVVFRSFLKTKFQLDGGEFGLLFSFPALGSMLGAFIFIVGNFAEPIKNLKYAVPCMVIVLLSMDHAPTIHIAAILLSLSGLFTYMTINSVTQSLHFEIHDRYRGRLGSIIAMGFTALAALMSFPLAYYADHYGFSRAIRDPIIIFAFASLILAILHGKLRRPARKIRPADIPPTTSNPL